MIPDNFLNNFKSTCNKKQSPMVEASNKSINYEVPFVYRKYFSTEECTELVNSFRNYDKDSNGIIDETEFKQVLKDMGHDEISDEKVT